ncbi:hypothetical protein HDU97_000249 [Phlyctochytrium planicorne]|nr:hypothetical protein HDU97_000249 [Phlyctochytrium planicorne]
MLRAVNSSMQPLPKRRLRPREPYPVEEPPEDQAREQEPKSIPNHPTSPIPKPMAAQHAFQELIDPADEESREDDGHGDGKFDGRLDGRVMHLSQVEQAFHHQAPASKKRRTVPATPVSSTGHPGYYPFNPLLLQTLHQRQKPSLQRQKYDASIAAATGFGGSPSDHLSPFHFASPLFTPRPAASSEAYAPFTPPLTTTRPPPTKSSRNMATPHPFTTSSSKLQGLYGYPFLTSPANHVPALENSPNMSPSQIPLPLSMAGMSPYYMYGSGLNPWMFPYPPFPYYPGAGLFGGIPGMPAMPGLPPSPYYHPYYAAALAAGYPYFHQNPYSPGVGAQYPKQRLRPPARPTSVAQKLSSGSSVSDGSPSPSTRPVNTSKPPPAVPQEDPTLFPRSRMKENEILSSAASSNRRYSGPATALPGSSQHVLSTPTSKLAASSTPSHLLIKALMSASSDSVAADATTMAQVARVLEAECAPDHQRTLATSKAMLTNPTDMAFWNGTALRDGNLGPSLSTSSEEHVGSATPTSAVGKALDRRGSLYAEPHSQDGQLAIPVESLDQMLLISSLYGSQQPGAPIATTSALTSLNASNSHNNGDPNDPSLFNGQSQSHFFADGPATTALPQAWAEKDILDRARSIQESISTPPSTPLGDALDGTHNANSFLAALQGPGVSWDGDIGSQFSAKEPSQQDHDDKAGSNGDNIAQPIAGSKVTRQAAKVDDLQAQSTSRGETSAAMLASPIDSSPAANPVWPQDTAEAERNRRVKLEEMQGDEEEETPSQERQDLRIDTNQASDKTSSVKGEKVLSRPLASNGIVEAGSPFASFSRPKHLVPASEFFDKPESGRTSSGESVAPTSLPIDPMIMAYGWMPPLGDPSLAAFYGTRSPGSPYHPFPYYQYPRGMGADFQKAAAKGAASVGQAAGKGKKRQAVDSTPPYSPSGLPAGTSSLHQQQVPNPYYGMDHRHASWSYGKGYFSPFAPYGMDPWMGMAGAGPPSQIAGTRKRQAADAPEGSVPPLARAARTSMAQATPSTQVDLDALENAPVASPQISPVEAASSLPTPIASAVNSPANQARGIGAPSLPQFHMGASPGQSFTGGAWGAYDPYGAFYRGAYMMNQFVGSDGGAGGAGMKPKGMDPRKSSSGNHEVPRVTRSSSKAASQENSIVDASASHAVDGQSFNRADELREGRSKAPRKLLPLAPFPQGLYSGRETRAAHRRAESNISQIAISAESLVNGAAVAIPKTTSVAENNFRMDPATESLMHLQHPRLANASPSSSALSVPNPVVAVEPFRIDAAAEPFLNLQHSSLSSNPSSSSFLQHPQLSTSSSSASSLSLHSESSGFRMELSRGMGDMSMSSQTFVRSSEVGNDGNSSSQSTLASQLETHIEMAKFNPSTPSKDPFSNQFLMTPFGARTQEQASLNVSEAPAGRGSRPSSPLHTSSSFSSTFEPFSSEAVGLGGVDGVASALSATSSISSSQGIAPSSLGMPSASSSVGIPEVLSPVLAAGGGFACPVPNCGKVFMKLYSMKIHMITHSTEKPHQCLFCTVSFARKHDLVRHMRTLHSQKLPLPCMLCDTVLSKIGEVQDHLRKCKGVISTNTKAPSTPRKSVRNKKLAAESGSNGDAVPSSPLTAGAFGVTGDEDVGGGLSSLSAASSSAPVPPQTAMELALLMQQQGGETVSAPATPTTSRRKAPARPKKKKDTEGEETGADVSGAGVEGVKGDDGGAGVSGHVGGARVMRNATMKASLNRAGSVGGGGAPTP